MSREQQEKAMTYRQLRDQLNALPESSLDHKVCWSGEDKGGWIASVWVLEEDHCNPSGDGWEPRSGVEKYLIKEGMTEQEAQDEAEAEVVAVKGLPVLMVSE